MQCRYCKFQMLFNNKRNFYCATNMHTYHLQMNNNKSLTPIENCPRFIKGKGVDIVLEYRDFGDFCKKAGSLISTEDWEYFKNNNINIIFA